MSDLTARNKGNETNYNMLREILAADCFNNVKTQQSNHKVTLHFAEVKNPVINIPNFLSGTKWVLQLNFM